MKKTLLTALGCLSLHPLFSQTHVDALRFSSTRFGSTARNLSMGGAFGAPGADASVLHVNPAGLGQYRASEFTFGLGGHGTRNSALYNGSSTSSNTFNLSLPNLAYVGTKVLRDGTEEGWQSYSLGIGLNRINSFWRDMNFEGNNRHSSITHYFAERAQGIPQADLDINSIEGLAYNTYLINPSGTNTYSSAIGDSNLNLNQGGRLLSEGNMNEYNLAVGANYNNRFYVGLGVYVTTLRFASAETFTEDDESAASEFKSMEFNSRLNTSGTGIGARIGFIFRASDMLRLGASLQTPTSFNMLDDYDYSMRSQFDSGSNYNYASEALGFEYKMSTPLKATFSGALLFAKKALLSADVEYIDYSRANFNSIDYDYKEVNRDIGNYYKSALNLRLGAEYVYEVFRMRAGFAWYGSPFSSEYSSSETDASQKSFTAGIGIRGATYFVDLGFMHSITEDSYTPYILSDRTVYSVNNKFRSNNVVVTAGFRFE